MPKSKHQSRKRRKKQPSSVLRASPMLRAAAGPWWAGAAGLLLLAAAVFWPTLFAEFVWDDKAFFAAPPVAAWDGLAAIWLAPAELPFEAHYWPVLYSSFWLDHKLWGFENPGGFHFTNLLLHGANAVLLWRLLLRLALPGAWFVAAAFAVHPVHVEAVAWVMSRKDLLGTLFYLLACGSWLRFQELPARARRMTTQPYLAMLGFFAAGMLSKTFVITLPAALLVWAWWRRGELSRRDFIHTAPLFALGACIAYFALRFYFGRAEIDFQHDWGWTERLIIAAKSLWFYAGQLLQPLPLTVVYPHWDTDPAALRNWLPVLAAAGLALGLWLARHRIGRGPLAGALFFAITLSPMLGFGDNSYMEYSFVADRYQYLAGTGLVAVIVAGVVMGWRRLALGVNGDGDGGGEAAGRRSMLMRRLGLDGGNDGNRGSAGGSIGGIGAAGNIPAALAAALLAIWGLLSWRQSWVYENEIALFSHIIARNPAAHSAHYNLGIALMEEGRREEAEAAYREEVRQNPGEEKYLNAINHLASLHFEDGNYEKARALYQFSVEANPADADTHQNLGSALAQLRRFREALASFERALAINPGLTMARDNMRLAQRMLEEGGGNAPPNEGRPAPRATEPARDATEPTPRATEPAPGSNGNAGRE